MVALELLVRAAVVTMRFADVAAAATVTEEATVSAALEFERVTLAPPAGAGWVRVTVQMLEAFEPRLVGLHETAATDTEGATRLTGAVAELLLYVAVTVELALLLTVAVVTLNVADVAPAPTVTDAGTFNVALVSDSATAAPPVGADWLRVTVHVLEAFEPRLVGLHETADTDTEGATRLTVEVAELPL